MLTKKWKLRTLIGVSGVAGLVVYSLVGYGGVLEPSGPPGPTMKTLEQIEPRIIANELGGDVDAKVHISQPGNYYLIADVISVDNNKNGIKITADDVNLDLNGFVVGSNVEVTSLDGILIDDDLTGITIRNGTIRDFQGDGVNGGGASAQCRLERLNIFRNGDNGIEAGDGSIVLDCTAFDNGGFGLAAQGTLVHRCSFLNNTGGPMFLAGTSSQYDNNF